MKRYNSLIVISNHEEYRLSLSDIVESDSEIIWNGSAFLATPGIAGFYEWIRSCGNGDPIGIELHLANTRFDEVLSRVAGFTKAPHSVLHRWRFYYRSEEGRIEWEQIVSRNPYVSSDGDVMIIAQLDHLSDAEYCKVAMYCSNAPR